MGRIQQLPPEVVNKIAAGEVIERPAAVVKELVENAIDAGATVIEVAVEDGGARSIRVTDDGQGIDVADLALAFASHATSKIEDVEDLDAVATLGFRGEALPSIGAVAQCHIRSRPAGCEVAAEVRCEGGRLSMIDEVGGPYGTTVHVSNLFYNTPVRRKFLKRKATEISHITAMVTRQALGHPEVAFTLLHDGRELLRTHPPSASPGDGEDGDGGDLFATRIGELFGGEIKRDLIPVRAQRDTMSLEGYVLPIHHTRRDSSGIHVFLNGRFLRDKVLLSAVARAYKELLPQGRQPVVFIHLLVAPHEVDVNVHPTKTEVRFRRSGDIHSFVSSAVGDAVRTPDAAPPVTRVGSHGFGAGHTRPVAPAATPRVAETATLQPGLFAGSSGRAGGGGTRAPTPSAEAARPYDRRAATQVHNAFLLEETPEGINVIDQHALHERILTERIRERVHAEGMPAQRLLQPIAVHLTRAEVEQLMSMKDDLVRSGVDLDRFGEDSVGVHALPSMLAAKLGEVEVRELVRSLVSEAAAREIAEQTGCGGVGEGEPSSFLDRAIYSMACRAAVKIGDPLAASEVQAILKMRDALGGRHLTCPHGRPTTLRLTMEELRRRFERE